MLSIDQLKRFRYLAEIVAICSAGIVPFYLLWMILNNSYMQYGDYFYMLGSLFSPNGVFTPSGLIERANEHLILIPKIIYLFNVKFFDGSNIALGVIVWIASLATAILLAWQLRPIFKTSTSDRIILAWLFAVFLFPLAAAHNYLHAMSGASWILANFFVVCALVLASNKRLISAGLFGSLATFSYGTGLAVWPALLIIVILNRQVNWRTIFMAAIGLASIAFERLTSVPVLHHPLIETNPLIIIRSVQISIGSIFSKSPEIALIFGAISLVFNGFSFLYFIRAESVNSFKKLILGIVVYGIAVFILFALSRGGSDGVLLSSRYMGVVGLYSLGTALLLVFVFSQRIIWHLIISLLIILNLTNSVPILTITQATVRYHQELGAIAARLDIAHGTIFQYGEKTGSVLRSLNHYPFNAKGDSLFCDLQGKKIESTLPAHEYGIHGSSDTARQLSKSGAFEISGWVYSENEIECILIVNSNNVVVGAAVHGWDRDDARRVIQAKRKDIGWIGVALADSKANIRTVIRLKGRPFLYEINKSF